MPSLRPILVCLATLAALSRGPAGPAAALPVPLPADEAALASLMARLAEDGDFGGRVAAAGEALVGKPYISHPLTLAGASEEEPLVARLDGFDCVTLVETALAISRLRTRAPGQRTWDGFQCELESLRYRDGKRKGYVSRLHYFSEWLRDNDRRGNVQELTAALGGVADSRPLRFMSNHRKAYKALAEHAVFAAFQRDEAALGRWTRHVIPKARITGVLPLIQPGDVLAFATDIDGLDVSHVGLAVRQPSGAIHVLHAPEPGEPVQISKRPLPAYTERFSHHVGLMVARPVAPPWLTRP